MLLINNGQEHFFFALDLAIANCDFKSLSNQRIGSIMSFLPFSQTKPTDLQPFCPNRCLGERFDPWSETPNH